VVTAMNFTRRWLDCQRRIAQGIMRTVHATLRWGFFILLNSHVVTPDEIVTAIALPEQVPERILNSSP
jgi:hypothetical protein